MPTPMTKQQLDAAMHERGLGSAPTVITSGCCEADSMTVAYFGTPAPKPFRRHVLIKLEWDREAGRAIMEGPSALFEPEHLTLGDEVLNVVEVRLIGIKSEGSVTKVTAQRGTST